jgi:5-methylcytosine-specific restriction endonuclease McrA
VSPEPATEERVSLSFSLTAEDYESFEQAKAILARKLPANMSLEDTFNELVAFYLAKKRPPGKPKKKPKRKTRKQSAGRTGPGRSAKNPTRGRTSTPSTGHAAETDTQVSSDDETRTAASHDTRIDVSTEAARPGRPASEPRSRHVPTDTRAAVLDRDGHRCTFVAADGTRCNATRNLQIDHVQPFALGGSHEAHNLRVLCAAHNRRAAEHVFGPLPRRKSGRDRR